MTELERKIANAAQSYYSDGKSDLTDDEFDALVDQLRQENPNSEILKKVGWGYEVDVDSTPGDKVKHKYGTAGSLDKARTWKELFDEFKGNWVDVSAKLDGLSVLLEYKDSQLVRATTRGDGEYGVDITDKVKAIVLENKSLICDKQFTGCVRGEIVMTHDAFTNFKSIHPEAKNPRNSAVGLINGLNITDDYKYLRVVVYSIVGVESLCMFDNERIIDITSIHNIRQWLHENFDYTAPHMSVRVDEDTFLGEFEELKSDWDFDYPIDGLVLTSNDVKIENNIQVIQNSQAFKFKSETANAEVIEVEWNMSKTGYAVPRVRIEPVQLAGTTVQYCTGYNAKYILDNKVGPGAIVEVEKRGEIIPNINEVVEPSNDFHAPAFCPHCNSELEWSGVHLKCSNPACSNSNIQDALIWINTLSPTDGLGDSLIIKFLQKAYGDDITVYNIMNNRTDKFVFTRPNSLERRMGDMFRKLYSNDKIKLSDALRALNVPRLGDVTSNKLAKYPKLVSAICELSSLCLTNNESKPNPDELWYKLEEPVNGIALRPLLIEKIGEANAKSIIYNIDKFDRLKLIYDRIDWSVEEEVPSKGKVAITGKLSMKRADLEKIIKQAGYVPGDVSKDTKYLITDNPESTSSKTVKAKKLGVEMISAKDFLNMIRGE